MTNLSEPLRQFLTDWLAWAEGEAVDRKPFWRWWGLCGNALTLDDDILDDLRDLLLRDFGSTPYPFGSSAYCTARAARTQHLDPNRLAWVRAKLATSDGD